MHGTVPDQLSRWSAQQAVCRDVCTRAWLWQPVDAACMQLAVTRSSESLRMEWALARKLLPRLSAAAVSHSWLSLQVRPAGLPCLLASLQVDAIQCL